jgi:mono/diheme cytochrome c family protein
MSNQMTATRSNWFVAAFSIASVVAMSTASGQGAELEPRGDFDLTVSLAETDGGTPVAVGEGRMAMAVTQTARLFNAGGTGAFLHAAIGNCASYQVIDVAAGTIEINGYCSYRDGDGDAAYEQFATDGAVPLDAVAMTGTWIGGTGKFEQLEGEVTTEFAAAVQDGNMVLTGGSKTGSYRLAPEQDLAEEPEPVAGGDDDEAALFAALVDEGQELYRRNCAQCHGTDGEGPVAPPLDGAAILSSRSGTIGIIISGFEDHGMPAWGPVLDDREIAAVATFIRNSWSNSHGIVLPDAVALRR